ncbi:hypothetical protein [Pseudaeromonas paramecii]|uniref:Uncharacterized protein n=1 Tax=Pseudaeromonas paramecii TaxID=2138166 RepID=A0ABP8PVA3_9GAMM
MTDRYFAFDPDSGFETFKTEQAAIEFASDTIDEYREVSEDGWPEEVEQVCWGEIRQLSKKVKERPAPPGSDYDCICDYELGDVLGSQDVPIGQRDELLNAITGMTAMLKNHEWADLLSTIPEVADLDVAITSLVNCRQRMKEQRDELLAALVAVQAVANNSQGIAGWHLNGDLAGWDELLPEVGMAIANVTGGGACTTTPTTP